MKNLLILLIVVFNASCSKSFLPATFGNRNVYKTKANLSVRKVYAGDRPSTDQRGFTIVPNTIPSVTKTVTTITTTPATSTTTSQRTTTDVVTTIPETKTTTSVTTVDANPPSTTTVTSTTTTFSNAPPQPTKYFIRYKVVTDEGDFKYIKVLPGCRFDGTSPTDTNIVFNNTGTVPSDKPEDYIFRASKKDLVPTTHYLASSALIGKVITIPVRIRNEYWNDNNKVLQGTLAIVRVSWKSRTSCSKFF